MNGKSLSPNTLLLAVALAWLALPVISPAAPRLKVSDNKHFLVKEDGSPFFYLGDTAWELFHRLNREEADLYLKNRAAKGFTVIQAVVLAEFDGLTAPNAYGFLPLKGNDPAKPNEDYFKHVDYIVNKAEEQGMYVGMLPTWGDKWNKRWGAGPEIFSPDNARAYGEWLGQRYKDKAVIWILGGDRSPEKPEHLAIIRAMAEGLRKGDGGSHLMTFHPQGGHNSAKWFHQDSWLDFNMFQSGHGAVNIPNYEKTFANHQLAPAKPTLDGEPRYEDHPINWKPAEGWFDDWDVRQAAYWSMLSGACGHTYGNHNIWQFYQPNRKPVSAARTPWQKAIDHPGATQMGRMKALFESLPWQTLAPDQSVIEGDAGQGMYAARAARAADGSCVLVYIPAGKPVTVKLDKLSSAKVRASWWDPREGKAFTVGEFANQGTQTFEPFARGRGNDWLLVLDDPAKQYPMPGLPKPKKK
ncbi:MAG: glycoside hydrolase family 140 protein [Verrucomicrobiota bacterium]